MKILAIETSCEVASIALLCGSEAISTRLPSPPAHSATLLPGLRALLAQCGTGFSALDAIAFGTGPGSFTGVRLACGVAQGLALGCDLPVVPVCSLLALTEGCSASRVYCAMDARMNEVYVAAYVRGQQGWMELVAPACVAPDDAPLPEDDDWCGAGSGFGVYPALARRVGRRVRIEALQTAPTAEAVARLAVSTTPIDPALAAPLYVRDRVALTVAERVAAGGKA